jgi:hypothetical protein
MMPRFIFSALLISMICLFVIGGPIANALFQSPLDAPTATMAISSAAASPVISPFVSKVGWIIFGAVLATGIVLTLSRRSPPA